MERYEKYRDSGIEWLGEIPEEWEYSKLKYETTKIIDGTHFTPTYVSEGIPFLRVTDIQTNNIDLDNVKRIPKEEHKQLIKRCNASKGDVLLSKNGTIGITKVVDWNWEFSIFVSLCLLKFKENVSNRYFSFFFDSNIVDQQISESSKKTSVTNLHLDKIKELLIILPPKPEQTVIANYLERKTVEIDELIAQKERLLELYEEEKIAIINQAVTKGINPNVKLKDSGIDWLGEIPEHWEVKKLKYVASANPSNIDKKSKDNEEVVLLCNYVDVYKNEFINSELTFMNATAGEDQIRKFILEKGDVIATKDSETPDDIATPALVVEDFDKVVCGYHLTHIKPKSINGEYLFRYFQTNYLNSYFKVSTNGVTRYGLGVDKFNSALIINPSKLEQTAIVKHIETETARINAKITKTKKIITLQKEYRTALISEAVTGKIKVTQEVR